MNSEIVAWIANRAMAIEPNYLHQIMAGAVVRKSQSGTASMFSAVQNVAVVSIKGVLGPDDLAMWGSSYGDIKSGIIDAVQDPSIRAVALHINSHGGFAQGNFDAAALVAEAAKYKPIWAIVDEHAQSAAYALASGCTKVILPRTGAIGSIGVLVEHVDTSERLKSAGLNVTSIHYGALKTSGSSLKPLDEQAKARIQSDVNMLGEMFVDLVARNRKIDPQRVRDTEAGTFRGQAGVDAGLADAVMSPDAAFLALVNSLK